MQNRFCTFSLMFILLSGFIAYAQIPSQQPGTQLSIGDRIACQSAIEEVYFNHRENNGTKSDFSHSVPQDVIQRKAEDVILKSVALTKYWGVTITGSELQAELDRMGANSKSPTVLRELQSALGDDPQRMAECLARPLLVDRLIQTYYSRDDRFHGDLKARALQELRAFAEMVNVGAWFFGWIRIVRSLLAVSGGTPLSRT